jgi:hypothetical protein
MLPNQLWALSGSEMLERRINLVVVSLDAMVGCDGCRRAKNAVFGDVLCEQVRKSGRD